MKYCLWGDGVFILELLSIVGFISSVNFYVFSVIMCKITGEKPSSLEHVCYNFLLMTPWSCCCYIIGKRCLSFSVLFNITTPMKETEWCLLVFFKTRARYNVQKIVKYCMFTFNFHNDWHFFAIKHDRSFVQYVECFNKICNYFIKQSFLVFVFCFFLISKYIFRKLFLWRDWLAVWNACWHFTRRFQC